MAVDVLIDPSSGQIYWNDQVGVGTQTIAISGNATSAINVVGYSNFFSPGGGGLGTNILATFNDSATSTFVPGTNAYDLGSTALRWNFYGTGGNFTGVISTSSSTASTSTSTGALTVAGGLGVVGDVFISSAAGSKLSIMQSSGDEGGEIFLNKAVTNTTITTGVTIDVYQNRLRFFETGGSTRGAYIDLTACSSTVGTNLLSSGSGSGISNLNGLTATTQTFATGTSGSDFNISSSSSTHTFNIPYAGAASTGLITTQTQTIAGAKTFSGQTSITDSTAATSTTTGALIINGGVGIAGSIWSGQHIVTNTTTSSSTSTGAMLVFGGLGVSGQINAASMQLTGNAIISGNLQFNGVGTFGNATTDTINSLARYISDILPSVDNSYDLGNNSLGWRNFRVSGVGTVGGLTFSGGVVTTGTWSGTAISVLYGGTGQVTLSSNSVLLGNGTSGILTTSGSSGQVLVWQASGAPTFVSLSGDVTISAAGVAAIAANSVVLGTDTTGQYASTISISGSGITATAAAGDDGTAYTIYSSATSANTASAIVLRDGSNNFAAGTITANLTGTATTATLISVSNAATNSTHYITFSPSATGSGLATSSDTDLTYNPSTNVLTAGTFSGAHTGNLTGNVTGTASIASSAAAVNTVTDTSSTLYLLGSRSSTGIASTQIYVDSNISILGSQVTAGVWAGTAISAVNGGTGQVSYAIGDILYASSTTALAKLSAGTAGSVLASGGAGAAPFWKADATGAGGAPGGSTSHIQFNNGGSFGGTSFLTYNGNGNNDFIVSAPYSSSTQAQINIGLGATSFDGVTLGRFAGSANGTIIGINHASGFTGNFADFQLAGSSKFTIGFDGKVTVVGAFSLPTTAGTAGSILTSNGSGNQLYWSAPSSGGGAGTVAAPTAASLVAYYPGTGASVASYNRVEINTATASMELTAQSSLPALVVNAVNGSIADSVEFKSSFGDVYWAVSSNTQLLKSTNGGILKIDGSGAITITNPGSLYFYNSAESFSLNFVAAPTANVTYTLPPTAPATGTSVLQSNTTGTLSWVPMTAGGGSGTVTSGTAGSVAFYTGSGTTVGGAPGFTYTTSGTASTVNIFGGGTAGTHLFTVQAYSATSVRVGIGTNLPQYELEINGEISATNKSFVITHPTKPNKKLRYGSLEGPENGVYVRGELKNSNVIETPDHWIGLVHPDSITVTLTPIGRYAQLYVDKVEDYKIYISDDCMNPIHCYFTVWAERKDIPKLITEY